MRSWAVARASPAAVRVQRRPMVPAEKPLVVQVSEGDGWEEWVERPNFAASEEDDRHFVVDGVNGEIQFGPAVRLRGSRGVFDSEIASGFGSSHRERRRPVPCGRLRVRCVRRACCGIRVGRFPGSCAASVGASTRGGQPMLLKWWRGGLPAGSGPSRPSCVVSGRSAATGPAGVTRRSRRGSASTNNNHAVDVVGQGARRGAAAGAGEGDRSAPLMINVVVPDSVLLGDDDGFGWVQHYGPVPGDLLREWIAANAEQGVDQWVRRLYASPKTGELVSMDSKSRRFEGALADYLRLRDRKCRTLYCDAPVRHLDHAEAHADGGPTSAANGQGLCEYCNYAKDALGWSARPRPGPRHTIETVTPTGHRYTSTAPRFTVAERGLVIRLDGYLRSA